MRDELEYGPVAIENFFDELRIGYYDDEAEEGLAVVYPGDALLAMNVGHYTIPYYCLRNVTTDDLWSRRNTIFAKIGPQARFLPERKKLSLKKRYELLLELAFVDSVLMDRLFIARMTSKKKHTVFISHSSQDKQFVRWLATDIANAGHRPWLDEWEISAGQSIPTEIGVGIEESDFILIVLSSNSVKSRWVEREWQAKYWDEVQQDRIMVIPVLIEDCDPPTLLKTKKYADFRTDYNEGLEEVLEAIKNLKKKLASRSKKLKNPSNKSPT